MIWIFAHTKRALYHCEEVWRGNFRVQVRLGTDTALFYENTIVSNELAQLLIAEKQATVQTSFLR